MTVAHKKLLAIYIAVSSADAFSAMTSVIPQRAVVHPTTTMTTTSRSQGIRTPLSVLMQPTTSGSDETTTQNIDFATTKTATTTTTPLFMEPDNASTAMDVAGTPQGFLNNLQDFDLDGLLSAQQQKLRNTIGSFNLESMVNNLGKAGENFMSGELGQRGEVYVLAQGTLVLGILGGGIPYIGDFLYLIGGPGMLTLGLGIIALGLRDIGPSLNLWTAPTPNTKLVTTGVFNEVRHPIYTGLLFTMLGISFTTGSASRLILTALLWCVLDAKSDYEEEQLVNEFGEEYADYMKQVPGKFFPAELAYNLRLFW